MSRNNIVGPQVRERLRSQRYEGVAIETADTPVDASHGVVLHSAPWRKPCCCRHIGDAMPASARVDRSSEQWRTQLGKYRLAIEAIARRYVRFCTF
jgi:hypothetical protein